MRGVFRAVFVGVLLPSLGCRAPCDLRSDPTPQELHVCKNCRDHVDAMTVDFETCESGQDCSKLERDLDQLADLWGKNKDAVAAARAQIQGCQGKGAQATECRALASAIARIGCGG